MHLSHDIGTIPPSSAEMGELALALERAEFDGAPELQPETFPEYPCSPRPSHPDLDAYLAAWRLIETAHKRPKIDQAHPRKHVETARAYFKSCYAEFNRRVQSRVEDVCHGGLRRLIDSYFRWSMAYGDQCSLEFQAKTLNKQKRASREAESDALFEDVGFSESETTVPPRVIRRANDA